MVTIAVSPPGGLPALLSICRTEIGSYPTTSTSNERHQARRRESHALTSRTARAWPGSLRQRRDASELAVLAQRARRIRRRSYYRWIDIHNPIARNRCPHHRSPASTHIGEPHDPVFVGGHARWNHDNVTLCPQRASTLGGIARFAGLSGTDKVESGIPRIRSA